MSPLILLGTGVLDEFRRISPHLEGLIDCMYRDSIGANKDPALHKPLGGLVTTAIGVLIDPVDLALPLPWVRVRDGLPATPDEIRAEWQKIKTWPNLNRDGAGAARRLCDLRLTAEGVQQATTATLERMLWQLLKDFPELPEWPPSAQLAVLLLVWAVGTDLPRKWPKLTAALRARDWAEAGAQAKIREEGNPGVVPRNREIKRLFDGLAERATTIPAPAPTEPQAEEIPGAAEAHASAQLLNRQELEGWAKDGWRGRE